MSSFNLPPGVESYMIPGNRPEDEKFEAFLEAILSNLREDLGYEMNLSEDEIRFCEARWREEESPTEIADELFFRRIGVE